MGRARSIGMAAALVGLGACATTLPPDPVERALYVDATMVVRAQERDVWTVDRFALGNVAQGVAWSACQVSPEHRAALIAWLDARIARATAHAGGSAEAAWRKAGKDFGAIEELIELERVRAALAESKPDDCPFWLEPDARFSGMQGDARRAVLWIESRGQFAVNVQAGRAVRFSGGGSGRFLVGYGFSDRFTLAAGVEIGEAGRFDPNGDVTGELGGAFPLVMRFTDVSTIVDVELAAVTFLEGAEGWPPGLRANLGLGGLATRLGGVFAPAALLWIGYEYYPARGRDDPFHVIAIGTRIGVDIDL